MMIEADFTVAGFSELPGNNRGLNAGKDGIAEQFSAYFKEEIAAGGGGVPEEKNVGGGIAAGSDVVEEDSEYNRDIELIKEKGIVAFINEQREKRIREEILASMGLTEEALAKMPPEQRARIEKMIAEETKKRLAAEALVDKDSDKKTDAEKMEQLAMGTGL